MKKISNLIIEQSDKAKEQPLISDKADTILTGFANIDNFTNGFQRGDLILIGSRPSVGKSTLGLQIALNLSKSTKNSILIFSLELTAKNVSGRLLSYLTSTPPYSIKKSISHYNLEKMHEGTSDLLSRQIYIDDSSSYTVKDIMIKSQEFKRNSKIDLILIDYLQLINFTEIKDFKEHTKYILDSLKVLARELNCPIIILSQLNRIVDTRGEYRPLLKDISHYEDILQSVDHVILISKKRTLKNGRNQNSHICDLSISSGNELCHNLIKSKLTWNNYDSAFENSEQFSNGTHSSCYSPSNYSFDNFISSNNSYQTAQMFCNTFTTPSNNFESITALFINGDFGLGKSHLLQAMFLQISQCTPYKKVALLNARDFTEELIKFIKINKYNDFILKYTEDLDVLLLDDIHYFKNKSASQETLSIVVDYFLTTGKQITLTSANDINFLAELNSRLGNQFAQLVTIKLTQPEPRTCFEIIMQFCNQNNFSLSSEIICYITETTERNPRSLKGKFIQLKSYCEIMNVSPTLEIAKLFLQAKPDL